jgi:hypothetical protein
VLGCANGQRSPNTVTQAREQDNLNCFHKKMLVNSTAQVKKKKATQNARTVLTVLIQGVVFEISPTTLRKQKVSRERKSLSHSSRLAIEGGGGIK